MPVTHNNKQYSGVTSSNTTDNLWVSLWRSNRLAHNRSKTSSIEFRKLSTAATGVIHAISHMKHKPATSINIHWTCCCQGESNVARLCQLLLLLLQVTRSHSAHTNRCFTCAFCTRTATPQLSTTSAPPPWLLYNKPQLVHQLYCQLPASA